jgi:pimeloyl-ACP methyl ester carboxylesterase
MEDAVLLGHSYGGMPITGAADRLSDRLSALVYLDAIVPEDGQSALAIRSAEPGAVPLPESADGISVSTPPATVFGLEGELAALAERFLTPHPLRTMTQPIHLTGAWRGVARKLYIRCGQYPGPYFDRYLAAAEAASDWVAIATDLPHNIMLTDPDWLAGVLREHVL